MKKYVIILLFHALFSSLTAKPYKPYPILWIHGIGVDSDVWGTEAYKDGEAFTDSIKSIETGSTYEHFLNYMNHYAIVWDAIDPSYTKPGDNNIPPGEGTYPNKTFLEIINFDHMCGSIDPGGEGWPSPDEYQIGWGAELRQRLKEVLQEYYGNNWANNPDAKLILICHSQGGLATREALYEDDVQENGLLREHIEMVITTGTPHTGTPFMNYYGMGELWTGLLLYWLPIDFFITKYLWNPSYWHVGWEHFWISWNSSIVGILPGSVAGLGFGADWFSWLQLHKYTDSDRDLGSHLNPFMNHICSSDALQIAKKVPFRTIVSTIDMPNGVDIIVWGIAGAQAAAYSAQFRFVEAALKLASAYTFFDWTNNSDLAVHKNSQKAAGLGIRTEILGIYKKNHGEETKNYESFIDAIEDKPIIHLDSVITVDDEVYPISGTKDTVPGFIKGFWGRVDDYLLASNDLRISCNYFTPRRQNIRM